MSIRSGTPRSLPPKSVLARPRRPSLRRPLKTIGRATIELVMLPSGEAQVRVMRWCDKPTMVETVTAMLTAVEHLPHVVVTPFDPDELLRKRHKGGPIPPSDTEKLRIVREWLKVQGQMNQKVFARQHSISPATLRRWMRQLEEQGRL